MLLSRRWIGALTLATLFAVVAVLLGNWQYGRHQDKAERRDIAQSNYDATPVPVREILTAPRQELDPTQEWARVRATGRYLPLEQVLVRNRPYRGVYGYDVLVPLELDPPATGAQQGQESVTLVVDRGWVQNADNAATLPQVPTPPTGEVKVTGWLRSSEKDLQRDLPAGQVASINVPEVQEIIGRQALSAYLVLDSETPAADERPAPAEPPDLGVGVHFAYALQWWLTAPAGVVLVLVMARREHREGVGGEGRTVPRPRPARRKRIWDDEDA
ncbi:MAG: SURF1 family protein [Ornithinimicrobium sp.]